ncbi:helix-turn-helix domain-containing protein [Streptomyces sp. H27-C3]|uniref:helix-turn-helix domain-containing protein n=1 Tax=Streptomyces sp. H27-C3 TaxID=3046305 RepID=UPI0024B93FE7|nr:helix-turn-helix domain-containing protein [Streptomyces sp. H27-C3]MDJ0462971.1 helix-turn-helix domain-containing protein [Streptomyces sp. H27-C3]
MQAAPWGGWDSNPQHPQAADRPCTPADRRPAGTSRESTTKVLREYGGQGLIRLVRGRITVLDTDRLKDQAG